MNSVNKALVESTKLLDERGRALLDRICVQLSGEEGQRIVFTGASHGVGTSFMALHVAQTIAGYGKQVLLIDADLRKGWEREEYSFLGKEKCYGLKQYYAGLCEIEDMLYETNVNHLSLIPAGGMVSRPVSLLETQDFAQLLDWCSQAYDLVLIDTPAVGLTSDAVKVGQRCDGLILVAEYNKTRQRELREIREYLDWAGCPMMGCVLNRVDFKSLASKRYYRMVRRMGSRDSLSGWLKGALAEARQGNRLLGRQESAKFEEKTKDG